METFVNSCLQRQTVLCTLVPEFDTGEVQEIDKALLLRRRRVCSRELGSIYHQYLAEQLTRQPLGFCPIADATRR
jgi:hypothetical protein